MAATAAAPSSLLFSSPDAAAAVRVSAVFNASSTADYDVLVTTPSAAASVVLRLTATFPAAADSLTLTSEGGNVGELSNGAPEADLDVAGADRRTLLAASAADGTEFRFFLWHVVEGTTTSVLQVLSPPNDVDFVRGVAETRPAVLGVHYPRFAIDAVTLLPSGALALPSADDETYPMPLSLQWQPDATGPLTLDAELAAASTDGGSVAVVQSLSLTVNAVDVRLDETGASTNIFPGETDVVPAYVAVVRAPDVVVESIDATVVSGADNVVSLAVGADGTLSVTAAGDAAGGPVQVELVAVWNGGASRSNPLVVGGIAVGAATVVPTASDADTIVRVSPLPTALYENGTTDVIAVVLTQAPPTTPYAVPVATSAPAAVSLSPASLTFSDTNWSVEQTVTLTGIDDDGLDNGDGTEFSVIAGSPSTVVSGGFVVDDDVIGFQVVYAPDPLLAFEAGSINTFTVGLSARPLDDVSVGIASDDPGEGTALPSEATWTPVNWRNLITVTVMGVDDDEDDRVQAFEIDFDGKSSSSFDWASARMSQVVLCLDDDTTALQVSNVTGPVTEDGGTSKFLVAIGSINTDVTDTLVTVTITSDDESEGIIIDPPGGQFDITEDNWSEPTIVTVQGVDDRLADGEAFFTIAYQSSLNDRGRITCLNEDNDVAALAVSPFAGACDELGGTTTFTVALETVPFAAVTVSVVSGDGDEVDVVDRNIVFTPDTWSTPATVTLVGVRDDDPDDVDATARIAIGVSDTVSVLDDPYRDLEPLLVDIGNGNVVFPRIDSIAPLLVPRAVAGLAGTALALQVAHIRPGMALNVACKCKKASLKCTTLCFRDGEQLY